MITLTTNLTRRLKIVLALFILLIGSSLSSLAVPVTISVSSNFTDYQNVSYSGILVPGGGGKRYLGPNEDIIINTGITLSINLTGHTVKSITLGSGGSSSVTLKILSTYSFTVTQGFTANTSGAKRIIFLSAGTLTSGGFTGTNYTLTPASGKIQMTGGSLPAGVTSIYNLTINAGSTVTLSNNVNVTNTLELKSGILDASTYNMIVKNVAGSSGISGTAPSNNSYVNTSNGGSLTRDAGNGILYPVGASVYAPVTLGLTVTRTFTVSVVDGVEDINGVPLTDHVILNTWSISSPSSVNADVLVSLGWQDESKEGTGFDDAKNAIFVLEPDSTNWATLNAFTAENANTQQNLAINKFQNSSVYKFAVGDATGYSLINDAIALPVEFLSFTATKQGKNMAVLNFSTVWEVNNAGFEVERSTNGISWSNIGFVQGKGNSTEINNYSFATSIASISAPVVYYRLKQVDFNGQFKYSVTRALRLSADEVPVVGVYPNPAINTVSVTLKDIAVGQTATISFIDMSGKTILSVNQVVETDNATIDLNIDKLTKGNYIINVSSPSNNYQTKLVKF